MKDRRPTPVTPAPAPRSPSSSSGSSLVLTLLLVAILSLVAAGFLSTSRIESIAAKNFTRQNAASGLAELATQQAMAKIQEGFTVNGTGTTIITTQPGAIWQYTFSSGSCDAVTDKSPVELFSTNGTIQANLNNLQNPGNATANATSNQFTLTGNRTERILVPMENITSNGTVIGRVAYYVDDEGTKLNANSATGNRTTLNASNRPQDIAALASSAGGSFSGIINSPSSDTRSITGWSHFFRPDQVGAAVSGISGNHTPLISTATSSASTTANMTHLLTPWGTQKIDINALSTNATDGTGDASVRSIFEALTGLNATSVNGTYSASNSNYGLTGRGLQNVFGGNFSAKYTPLGVKQIAANMLQMRDPNTNSVNASFAYSGPLIGSRNLTAESTEPTKRGFEGIPTEYLGYAPYPVITEIGMSARWFVRGGGPTTIVLRDPITGNITGNQTIQQFDLGLQMEPVVEFYNPYPYPFTIPEGAFPRILIYPSKVTFEMSWTAANGSFTGNFSTSLFQNPAAIIPAGWNYSSSFGQYRYDGAFFANLGDYKYSTIYQANGNFTTIPAYSKIQTRFYTPWGTFFFIPREPGINGSYPNNNSNITINYIRNVKFEFYNIKLLANSNTAAGERNAAAGHRTHIRDWILGGEVGSMDVEMLTQPFPFVLTWNGTLLNRPINSAWDWGTGANGTAPPIPTKTAQRISHLTKLPSNPAISIDDTNRNWTTTNNSVSTNWLETTATWGDSTSRNYGKLSSSTDANLSSAKALPIHSANYTIPSDPSLGGNVSSAVYAGNSNSEMREPFLATGNYTCPADLGFVPTNMRWRRLRMQMQPSAEGSMIPDWAMLEVISFGNSTNPSLPYNRMVPVNINSRFYLPGNVTNSAPPAPRTIGLKALANVLSLGGNGSIQDPTNPANSVSTDATRFKGHTANSTAIANAIGNMTWSENSTWGRGNSTSDPGSRRNTQNFPVNQYILPSEIMEIAGVADAVSQTNYNNPSSHFKWNEGRASALIPAVTTRSSFFMIYAYAQALDRQGNIDSEALTKTLVEVQYNSSTTPPSYSVKKLYTQAIPMGQ